MDLLETAWGVIAYADWDETSKSPGWQVAAETWRDRYHAYLKAAAEEAPKPEPKGRRARVEVKGFRDLGIVRVSETTLAGEPMLHAECDDGSSADFPPSSLHFITWLPEGAVGKTNPPRALGVAVDGWESDEDSVYDDGREEEPF
jgi:hypothetical protein